jgi:hypothetical protein
MMLAKVKPDKPYEVKFANFSGDLPRELKIANDVIFNKNESQNNNYSIPRIVLSAHGTRSLITMQDDINIINYIVAGITEPIAIEIKDIAFSNKYSFSQDCILILNKYYVDGDIVLIDISNKLYICEYINNQFLSILNREEIKADNTEINVIGSIYRKLEGIFIR